MGRAIPKNVFLLLYVCLGSVLLTCSCTRAPKISEIATAQYQGYIPVEPLPQKTVSMYNTLVDSCIDTSWGALTSSQKIALLPLQTAEVSVRQVSVDGSIKYLGSSASVNKGSYEVIMDYMKYRVESVVDPEKGYIGSKRIGVGLRMTARVQTLKGSLNISGLGALSAAANTTSLRGSLSVNVIGIDSRDVTNLIPITSQLDQTSIQSALQALAAVKSKMWDTTETTITPHIVAVLQRKGDNLDKLESPVEVHQFTSSKLGDCIRNWWRPDGVVDQERTSSLNNWLGANKRLGAPSRIAELISGDIGDHVKSKVIKDLDIDCPPDN